MKLTPFKAGLLEAVGLAIYVAAFSATAHWAQRYLADSQIRPSPWGPMALFLLAFVISALVCSIIALGYPTLLFLEGKKREAIRVVLWCAASLMAIFAVYLLTLMLLL